MLSIDFVRLIADILSIRAAQAAKFRRSFAAYSKFSGIIFQARILSSEKAFSAWLFAPRSEIQFLTVLIIPCRVSLSDFGAATTISGFSASSLLLRLIILIASLFIIRVPALIIEKKTKDGFH
jgi:hypothetical protein